MKMSFERPGFFAASVCGLAVFLLTGVAEAQNDPAFECDNNFGECGTPEESVTPAKQRRLVEVAESYLEERGLREVDWRIDVVAIEWTRAGRLERVEIIRDAVSG